MKGVAICVPVLDDREGIADVLPRVARALAHVPHSVCVVDDGSRDGTLEWLRAWASDAPHRHVIERQKTRPGCLRGGATREGLRWLLANTECDVFVDLDADGSHRPEEIPAALTHLAAHPACEVVVASRYVPGSRVTGRPSSRRAGSRAYNALLRAGLSRAPRDCSNSYRFYRRAAAELATGADTRYDTPVFLVEMIAVWLAAGLPIDELRTHYDEREGGRSKVGWHDAVRGFSGAWDVIRGARQGRYRVG